MAGTADAASRATPAGLRPRAAPADRERPAAAALTGPHALPYADLRARAPARERQELHPLCAVACSDDIAAGAVVGDGVDIRGEQRQHSTRAGEERELRQRGGHGD